MRNIFLPLLLAGSALWAQTGWTEFSIGPPTANRSRFSQNGIRAEGVPLLRAIARAYGVPEHRVVGPTWIEAERYAITAEAASPEEFQQLFQQELASRFHMAARRERKEIPVFVLKAMEGGVIQGAAGSAAKGAMSGGLEATTTVAGFANLLADYVRRPVIDETGIDGTLHFALRWQRESMTSLQTAMKQQLGLQLQEERRQMDLVIIDHIEKLEFPKSAAK